MLLEIYIWVTTSQVFPELNPAIAIGVYPFLVIVILPALLPPADMEPVEPVFSSVTKSEVSVNRVQVPFGKCSEFWPI